MNAHPSFNEALRFWLKLGFISFGGPAGQIAVMHTELVERKKWIDEDRFLHALNFCMLLPGPEATQLAIYCGWRLHGTLGGIMAGVLFVLPGAVLLWALSYVYVSFGHVSVVASLFYGLKPAVTAIVLAAVIRIGRTSLKNWAMWLLASAAFVGLYFFRVPFPAVVAGAAGVGLLVAKARVIAPSPPMDTGLVGITNVAESTRSAWGYSAKILSVCVALWFAPVLLAFAVQGENGVLVQEGIFFSKAAMVTFGGAYAVLPYVGQQAVGHFGWLTAPQMLDGLGLAETTPGPLIIVVQFVGFLGGWGHPGTPSPILSATLGAAITTWTTFVPCFLWILLGAPHLERLRGIAWVSAALAAVTAAVVGVVLNLALWFAWQTFRPAGVIDWFAILVTGAAFVALQRFKLSVVWVVLLSGLCGLLLRAIT